MNGDIDNILEDCFDKLFDILRSINDSVATKCVNFCDEWKFNVVENLRIMIKDSIMEFEKQKCKINRNEMKCIFIGESSAGKSTLINAILNRSDLPRNVGRVTNSFVEIKRSPNDESYVRINNEIYNIASLNNLINYTSTTSLPKGSLVDLFYNQRECPFLMENMILIDTPGIDSDEEIDEMILSYCRGADLICLVVNASITINKTTKHFINRVISRFSNINFILINNHMDLIDLEEYPSATKGQLREDSENFFRDTINKQLDDSIDRTFYLSAREELPNIYRASDNSDQQIRRGEFIRFKRLLTTEMSINPLRRRINYLNKLFEIVTMIIEECRDVVERIIGIIPDASQNFINKLKEIDNLEKEINNSISTILNPLYKDFSESALREMKRDRNKRTQMERIFQSVQSILNTSLIDIKSVIINMIERNNDEDRMLIIMNMYFPHYLEYNFPVIYIDNTDGVETIKLVAGAVGITLAGFGIRQGITMTLAAVAAAAGAFVLGPILIAASVVLGAASLGYGGYKVYDMVCNKDERMIKKIWDELLKTTQESYSNFMTDINRKLSELFDGDRKREQLQEYERSVSILRMNLNERFVEYIAN